MARIAIGPGEVAGFFARLKSGLDAHGVSCEHFLLTPSRYQYAQHRHFLDGASRVALSWRGHRLAFIRLLGLALALVLRVAIFAYALVKYDTFLFNGSWSFFRFRELALLKLFKKRIVVIFLGSDARPPILCGRHLDDEGSLVDPIAAAAESRAILAKVRRIERHADVIINHTATDQFFLRPYVRLSAIGLPIELTADAVEGGTSDRRVRIVHAPSRPLAKGSHVFREVVEELREEGFDIEFIELVGVPNARVLEELARCDFILDELYSDTPMAMFATEAAMFGKPALVGSYYSDLYDRHNIDGPRPPSLFVHPSDIKSAVRKMIVDVDFRRDLGARARKFVEQEWSSAAVAGRLLDVVEDRIPSNWTVEPFGEGGYIWGWGLSDAHWHQQLNRYVAEAGVEALLLSHKPALLKRIRAEMAA